MSKIERINSELLKQISTIIDRELKHPVINGLISVTNVDATNDQSIAKVRVSIMGSTSPDKDVIIALNHSSGYIRKLLKGKMNIRNIPELVFYNDTSMEYAIKMSKLIDEINNK